MILVLGALGSFLNHEGGTLMDGIRALIKKGSKETPAPPTMGRRGESALAMNQEEAWSQHPNTLAP